MDVTKELKVGLWFGGVRALVLAALSTVVACASNGENPAASGAMGPAAPSSPVYLRSSLEAASASTIDDVLGAPSLTRKEGEGEFRRYSLSTCRLIIILYPDENGVMRAAHMDATSNLSGEEKPDLDACLAAG